MTLKLICNKNSPPFGGLAVAELIKDTVKVEVSWADETAIIYPNGDKLSCFSNNDVLRALARSAPKYELYGQSDPIIHTMVDQWLTFSLTCDRNPEESFAYLNKCLAPITYLVSNQLTIADLAVFHRVYKNYDDMRKNPSGVPNHVQRWYNLIIAKPCVKAVLAAVPADILLTPTHKSSNGGAPKSKFGDRKQEGKFIDLPGAEMGKVVVRFPPEASGYLHIGHAKAALLNQYYQEAFQGKLIMRFDDTNPAKENVHFEKVILEDLEMLEVKPDEFTHTSNYFDLMLEYCERMMKEGKAYVDDTEPEQMKLEREKLVESANRTNSVEKNFSMWQEMLKGSDRGKKCCVRAKIDMSSPNGCLRDPTIYRCKNEPHPRTGTKYKVYPTYDFACPIVDAIENVTHTLRTMEYHDRDDQFYWFIEALGLRRPYIWEFARLNMTNTVLSKRKLTWFVDEGLVEGWDDPRFPTVRGILRRGMTVEGLKQFIIAQGSSKSVVFMEWDKIWAFNKKVIDPIAPRYTALEGSGHVLVKVAGAKVENLIVPAHPKNAEVGNKTVTVAPEVLIDSLDADTLKEGENATFINWGNILIQKIHRDAKTQKISHVDAQLNLENKDFKKTVKLTWLAKLAPQEYTPTECVFFDHIISKAVLAKEEDFKQFIGKDSKTTVEMLGDPELKRCKEGDIIQLQRRGFFKVDIPYKPRSQLTGVESPIRLLSIPDGHAKEQPTAGGPKKAAAAVATGEQKKSNVSAEELNAKIVEQGNKVRQLKEAKAEKPAIEKEVKQLLEFKNQFKAATGSDWKPGASIPAAAAAQPVKKEASPVGGEIQAIHQKILDQGNLVRDLKGKKAAKGDIDVAVKTLLALKGDFKKAAGKDWTPDFKPSAAETSTPAAVVAPAAGGFVAIHENIVKQGNLVRDLKGKKAAKAEIDVAVKGLLSLKEDFKKSAGFDWKPDFKPETSAPAAAPVAAVATSSAGGFVAIHENIVKQGNLVRDLKGKKAAKGEIDTAVKSLLSLKEDFKKAAGFDWKPDFKPENKENIPVKSETSTPVAAAPTAGGFVAIHENIVKQGNLVRDLKGKKAAKAEIDVAVKGLLSLKEDFKKFAGFDWKPDFKPETSAPAAAPVAAVATSSAGGFVAIHENIVKQGNLVRDLKGKKATKPEIDAAVKTLLSLKEDFKKSAGFDWKPDFKTPTQSSAIESKPAPAMDSPKEALVAKVNEQGAVVRDLKGKKAAKGEIDAAVAKLLELKAEYKKVTGEDFPAPQAARQSKPAEAKPKAKPAPKPEPKKKAEGEGGPKKVTRLGLEATKEENLPDWYSQVITKGEMIEYYDVSGCYILRHWSFAIWKAIKNWFDAEITKMGVKECYFPIFVSRAALEKEKTHISDFAPEVAWVTKSGDSDLAEPIAVRPTSETVMYPAYAKWIQSYRDLPIRLNQWNNVVRWEFKHPQPFLRTREFLWQEGHTAFATKDEATEEVYQILDLYAKVYTDLLAIPVIKGRKTEKEKFAGGDFTTTVEAFISASGRAIQGATSHHLGQNFSKMFDIVFEDPETQQKQFVWQNSWGITTRTIGVMIMVHADNQGLVLPPNVAATQVVIVPCGITASLAEDEKKKLVGSCEKIEKQLVGCSVRTELDSRDNYSPGWKFNHWELKGVPIRLELGPKDLAAEQVVAVRRDNGEKIIIKFADVEKQIPALLIKIHQSMLAKAENDLKTHLKVTKQWPDFVKLLDEKNIIMAPFCGGIQCEDKIKADSQRDDSEADAGAPSMGAKSLCIPFEQPAKIEATDKCINPSCTAKPQNYTLFGRSY